MDIASVQNKNQKIPGLMQLDEFGGREAPPKLIQLLVFHGQCVSPEPLILGGVDEARITQSQGF